MSNKYVIYHANCNDGLSAAALHYILNGCKSYTYIEGHYHKDDYPDFTNSEIILLDFSFQEEKLKDVLKIAKEVVIIDHHISANKYIQPIFDSKLYTSFRRYYYNSKECGTSLVWLLFSKVSTPMPSAIKCVRDLDLYTWTNPNISKPFCMYMEMLDRKSENSLEIYINFWRSILLENPYSISSKIIDIGNTLLEYKNIQVENIWKSAKEIKYLNQSFIAINTPRLFVEELADIMLIKTTRKFLLAYNFDKDGINFSLRSDKDYNTLPYTLSISPNAGGHTTASGANLSFEEYNNHAIKKALECNK